MLNYKLEIANLIAEVTKIDTNELESYLEIPPERNMGDYAFPCFKLAKILKKAPPVIAEEIKGSINTNNTCIDKIEVVGGYLNIFVNKQQLIEEVLKEIDLKKDKYGFSNIGESKTAVIEYSSPNVAKPFHIGHLRSTVIGGALYKIYEALGYKTVGINYLGDWGLQFGKIMAGMELWKDEYNFDENPFPSFSCVFISIF